MSNEYDYDDDTNSYRLGSGASNSGGLAKLFDGDTKRSERGNQSLRYKAPQQPKAVAQPQVIFSTTAVSQLCKFDSSTKKYETVATTVGGVILAAKPYQKMVFMFYNQEKKTLCSATITPTFKYTVQQQVYANFVDDQRVNWSLSFKTPDGALECARAIALAILTVSQTNKVPLEAPVCMELSQGDNGAEAASDGLVLMCQYTGWLVSDDNPVAVGKVFDAKTKQGESFQFKLGGGQVIRGWDNGARGMRKGSRRLLIIPSELGYGAQGAPPLIPPKATLVFDLSAVDVMNPSQPKPSAAIQPAAQPASSATSAATPAAPENTAATAAAMAPTPDAPPAFDATAAGATQAGDEETDNPDADGDGRRSRRSSFEQGRSVLHNFGQNPSSDIARRMARMGQRAMPVPGGGGAGESSPSAPPHEPSQAYPQQPQSHTPSQAGPPQGMQPQG
eukprot:Rmarinus@m.5808